MSTLTFCLFILTFVPSIFGQDKDFSVLHRFSLQEYSLAKCTDGSPAAYYADRLPVTSTTKVLIYLADSGDKTSGFGGSCTFIDDCQKTCKANAARCRSPQDITKIQTGGIWSRDEVNNPFANYFKVFVPACSLDEFSGTRGPLDENGENRLVSGSLYFHGRHIFNSLLRDLVAKHGIDRADSVVLIGSGSGARGVARSCDFLKEAMSTVNQLTNVKCVLDGPTDFVPFWIQDDERTMDQCLKNRQALALKDEETRRFLWGRADDESCLKDLQDKTNSSALAQACGIYSRSFRHVATPIFVISGQLDTNSFNELTCGITPQDPDFEVYSSAWRRGMLQLAETMSNDRPENGWFIPNCDDDKGSIVLDEANAVKRQQTRVPLFSTGQDKNVLQVLNNWILKGSTNDEHLAIDPLGIFNPSCSNLKNGKLRSLNLDLRPDLFRRQNLNAPQKSAAVIQVIARKQQRPFFGGSGFDSKLRGRLPNVPPPNIQEDDIFGSLPFFNNDQDQFSGLDDNESAAAAAGAAAAAALAAADRESNYRKSSQVVKDPYYSNKNRFFSPLDYNPRVQDLNPPLDGLDFSQDFDLSDLADNNSEDDLDLNLGSFFPDSSSSAVTAEARPLLSEQSVPLAHSRSRKARLWRRLYYMQYLRELYKKTYREYYLDYYYGKSNGGFGRLTKKEGDLPELSGKLIKKDDTEGEEKQTEAKKDE